MPDRPNPFLNFKAGPAPEDMLPNPSDYGNLKPQSIRDSDANQRIKKIIDALSEKSDEELKQLAEYEPSIEEIITEPRQVSGRKRKKSSASNKKPKSAPVDEDKDEPILAGEDRGEIPQSFEGMRGLIDDEVDDNNEAKDSDSDSKSTDSWKKRVQDFHYALHNADFKERKKFSMYMTPITHQLLQLMADRYGASQVDMLEVLIWSMFRTHFSLGSANLATLVCALDELQLQISRYADEVDLLQTMVVGLTDCHNELIPPDLMVEKS